MLEILAGECTKAPALTRGLRIREVLDLEPAGL
jgi:hypothetical protein